MIITGKIHAIKCIRDASKVTVNVNGETVHNYAMGLRESKDLVEAIMEYGSQEGSAGRILEECRLIESAVDAIRGMV